VKRWVSVFAAATAADLIAVSIAVAGTLRVDATVAPGGASLALSLPSGATLADRLDGTDQGITYSLPLDVTDVRGSGSGWDLTMTSTTFTTGSRSLAPGSSTITGVSTACAPGGICTAPANAISYPLTVPASPEAPDAAQFFDAPDATGLGRFTVTPTIAIGIPGNAYAGDYTSVVTVAAVSGP